MNESGIICCRLETTMIDSYFRSIVGKYQKILSIQGSRVKQLISDFISFYETLDIFAGQSYYHRIFRPQHSNIQQRIEALKIKHHHYFYL